MASGLLIAWVLAAAPLEAPPEALSAAAFRGEVPALEAALAAGAPVNAHAARDWTALHWAVAGGRVEAVRALLRRGADANARGQFDLTPLHWAAMLGQAEVVTALTAGGANLEARSIAGMTPLHLAANAEVVTALAEAGAKLEQRDDLGLTPLFTVRSKEAGQKLLARGADLHARSKDGRSLFDMLVVNTLESKGLIIYGRRSSGRLRGEEATVSLQLLDVSPTALEEVAVSAQSVAATVVPAPVLARIAPGQLATATLTLLRTPGVAEGVSPLVVTVSSRGEKWGTFEIEIDCTRAETPADRGMVRLGQAKLKATGGRGYEYALLAVPVLVLLGWLAMRRRRS